MIRKRRHYYFPLILGIVLLGAYFVALETAPLRYFGREDVRELVFGTDMSYLLFAAVAAFIVFVVRLFDWIVFDRFASRKKNIVAPLLLREILSIVLYVVLLSSALSWIFGYSIRGLLATTTVVAAVVGLALQDTLGNLFAGISLHLERTYDVGDVVKSGEIIGVVEGVNWRATRLRTFANNVVILPNSLVARERIEVFPKNNLNSHLVRVGVQYEAPPAKVISVLERAVQNLDHVSRDIPALARVAEFGESAVTYEVKYWTSRYDMRDAIDAEVRRAIWYALNRNRLTIPFPIRTVHMAPQASTHVEDQREEIEQRLAAVELLAPLSAQERERLAETTERRTYSRGETILKRGEAGDSMFIVHSGRVSVRVQESGLVNEVAQLEEGSVFGEMALFTGESRSADVVAVTDVIALEIDKEAMQPILFNNPDLATVISTRVVERRTHLEASLQKGQTEDAKSILRRVRAWFGLGR